MNTRVKMENIKILTVLGARPQFIKAGAVSRAFATQPVITEVIVHTGQHYDSKMSDVFFEQMSIPKPNYNLGINGLGHGAMTGQMLEKIEEVIEIEKPDYLLVYGDTNSTLAGALAASKLHVPVIHIEAGLRSFNMLMPEEINRTLTDRVSTLLLCPTQSAMDNLSKEGYETLEHCEFHLVGDVMQDAALYYKEYAVKPEELKGTSVEEYILATLHRAENTDSKDNLTSIVKALNDLNKEKQVILPIHPRTKALIEKYGLEVEFTMIEPVGYLEMIWLLENSSLVMTDSGGLQKEAFFFSKPCITMRDQTEWVELINCGANILTGACYEKILSAYNIMKDKKVDDMKNLYGGGTASRKITSIILSMD